MKFQYLGTAAAEGWPALFCDCEACRKAREAGGRNLRSRSQAMVDDCLLIDFPPDTYFHMLRDGLDLGKVHHCLITHGHMDHFNPEDIDMRRVGFGHPRDPQPMTVYGSSPTEAKLRERIDLDIREQEGRLLFQRVVPFEMASIGGYQVVPLKADHAPSLDPLFYLVSDGNHRLLYAHDTGYFPDETWAYLEREKPLLDFVSLDCTCIGLPCRHNHMDMATCADVRQRLLQSGCADERTRFCLNHFSHNGLSTYDELVPVAAQAGFEVSYDGMVVMLTGR